MTGNESCNVLAAIWNEKINKEYKKRSTFRKMLAISKIREQSFFGKSDQGIKKSDKVRIRRPLQVTIDGEEVEIPTEVKEFSASENYMKGCFK